MNVREAIGQLKNAVRSYTARGEDGMPLIPRAAQRPVYLVGPPGVGKTAIAGQVAAELGVGLVSYTMTHHTRQSALGLPRIVERSLGGETRACTEYTMSEIIAGVYRQMEESGVHAGILFLDEINCVSETLTPAMLELLQHKRFGQYSVPEDWVIVCAGNPEAYNRAAHAFDPVTLDRLRVIRVEPELDAWMDYAAARGVHPAVRGYLRLKPEDFCAFSGEDIVSPRSWTDLSDMMLALEALGEQPGQALFAQYLQCPSIAEGFGLYFNMCRGVSERFGLERVLEGTDPEAERHFAAAPFDEALCAAMLLANCLNARAAEAARAEETAVRLESFVVGALREAGDAARRRPADGCASAHMAENAVQAAGDCLAACRTNLGRMEHALQVRAEVGALEPAAEAGERALFRAAREAMAACAGAEDQAGALRAFASARRERAQSALPGLRAAFVNGLAFARNAFQNVHARVIFLTELERAPASLRLMERELPETLSVLRSSTDPDARAAELRRRLGEGNR